MSAPQLLKDSGLSQKNKESIEGTVFNIQRYSIHDGPGIRTTIFVKGCPLRCGWCDNPESQNPYPEFFVKKDRCNQCAKCLDVCAPRAIALDETGLRIERTRCNFCMKCADICPTGALSRVGSIITVKEAVMVASRDELFYRNSEGGVTISGGEPLYQEGFTRNILQECKERLLHTTLDTCGHVHWEVFTRVLEYVDLVLFDIKHLDSEMHRKGTGVGNELILKNFQMVTKRVKVWVRVPVIPTFNDSPQHVERLANLLTGTHIEKVSLLGYHEWGKHKYQALGRDYQFEGISPLTEEKMQSLKNIIDSYGLKVTIGY